MQSVQLEQLRTSKDAKALVGDAYWLQMYKCTTSLQLML